MDALPHGGAGADVFGNITRIDNVIDGIAGKLDKVRSELADTETQMKNALQRKRSRWRPSPKPSASHPLP